MNQGTTLITLVLFHTLEKAHHHSRNYDLSGVVMLRVLITTTSLWPLTVKVARPGGVAADLSVCARHRQAACCSKCPLFCGHVYRHLTVAVGRDQGSRRQCHRRGGGKTPVPPTQEVLGRRRSPGRWDSVDEVLGQVGDSLPRVAQGNGKSRGPHPIGMVAGLKDLSAWAAWAGEGGEAGERV